MLSWKCPCHVLKCKGQNWMMDHILVNFLLSSLSAACCQSQSCVLSSIWNKKNSQINQIFQIHIWKITSIPLCKLSFPNSSFGITKPILITKWNKGCQEKICFANTKNVLQRISHPSPPLFPSDPGKNSLFSFLHFSSFDKIRARNFKLVVNPTTFAPCYIQMKSWLTMFSLGLVFL